MLVPQAQAPAPAYYPPPAQAYAYPPPPPPVAYYAPPPVAYYAPAYPVWRGPYYARWGYWRGYGPRFPYGYGPHFAYGYGRWGHGNGAMVIGVMAGIAEQTEPTLSGVRERVGDFRKVGHRRKNPPREPKIYRGRGHVCSALDFGQRERRPTR